jgi:hypothetical protein
MTTATTNETSLLRDLFKIVLLLEFYLAVFCLGSQFFLSLALLQVRCWSLLAPESLSGRGPGALANHSSGIFFEALTAQLQTPNAHLMN